MCGGAIEQILIGKERQVLRNHWAEGFAATIENRGNSYRYLLRQGCYAGHRDAKKHTPCNSSNVHGALTFFT